MNESDNESVEYVRRQRLHDGPHLLRCTEARRQDVVYVSRHRHIDVDVDTEVSRGLD